MQHDAQYKDLGELLPVTPAGATVTVSGVRDVDYPALNMEGLGGELSITRTTPIPPELVDKFVRK